VKNATALLVLCLVLAGSAGSSQASQGKIQGCLTIKGHAYEVCTAYLLKCASQALAPYYKYGRSPSQVQANLARHHFESRYNGQARRLFEQRVNGWHQGGTAQVDYGLTVKSVITSLKTNTAHLVTVEYWSISIPVFSGGTYQAFAELNSTHHVTMKRVPGLVEHKWVVTAYR
jgi:hypothetical protein